MIFEEIDQYAPFNEEEAKDKELIMQFIRNNPDYLYRSNCLAHLTTSALIINQKHDRLLMCYHNIFNSWSWCGGHNDGEEDCLKVALKEAHEETGLNDFKVLNNKIFSLESLTVDGHYKNNHYVSSHLHLNVTYLLEAVDSLPLKVRENENRALRWMTFEEFLTMPTEKWMIEHIYRKLVTKLRLYLNKRIK